MRATTASRRWAFAFSLFSLLGAAGCAEQSSAADGSTVADMKAAATAGKLVVNEVFAHGSDELTDPDWAELKNIGETELDLSGYQVRDDKTKATLPDGTSLAPGKYLVIYCDDVPDGGATERMHVPFKLGSDDEFYVLDPSGNRIDGATWDATTAPSGKSYGRLPDGTGQFTALTPTAAARNL